MNDSPPTTHVAIATVNKGGVRILSSANAIILNCTIQPLGTVVDLRLFMPYVGGGTAETGGGFGMTVLPKEGDEVVAMFPQGDINLGIAMWGLFNGVDKLPKGTAEGLILVEGRPGENVRMHIRGNVSLEIDQNEMRTVDMNRDTLIGLNDQRVVGVDDTEVVGGKQSSFVTETRDARILLSDSTEVGISKSTTVGVNESTTVGAMREVTVGGSETKAIGGSQVETVGAVKDVNVGGAHIEAAGGLRLMTVGGVLTINSIGPMTLMSGTGITFESFLIQAVLAGVGQQLCNSTFYELVKNHTHPDVDQSEELQDSEEEDCLTQVFRAQ
ncbi:hypothetical protein IT570_03490 [Candidatus Sumerlaeota bacterium]|nr:hypothetical protein [Candidatus Sumerlaeota bacterium]